MNHGNVKFGEWTNDLLMADVSGSFLHRGLWGGAFSLLCGGWSHFVFYSLRHQNESLECRATTPQPWASTDQLRRCGQTQTISAPKGRQLWEPQILPTVGICDEDDDDDDGDVYVYMY